MNFPKFFNKISGSIFIQLYKSIDPDLYWTLGSQIELEKETVGNIVVLLCRKYKDN